MTADLFADRFSFAVNRVLPHGVERDLFETDDDQQDATEARQEARVVEWCAGTGHLIIMEASA